MLLTRCFILNDFYETPYKSRFSHSLQTYTISHTISQFVFKNQIQSRSSSAQGSYSTSATTYEEAEDATGASKAGAKAKESKGNVLVSVRVRPDASESDAPKSGEWGLDGRRGVISYKGKEGGEYHYGMVVLCFEREIFHRDEPKGARIS